MLTPTPITTTLHTTTPEGLRALAEPWDALADDGSCAQPFFQHYWVSAFAHSCAPHYPITVALGRDSDGALTCILPLMQTRRCFGNLPARTLHSLSGIHSCRFDLVHRSNPPTTLARSIWNALKEAPDWNVIEALDVPPDGAFREILACAAADGFPTGTWPTRRSPYLPLPSPGRDPLENSPRSFKSFRARLRRKLHNLEKEGTVTFELHTTDFSAALQEFFALEAAGWKGARGSAIALHQNLVQFYSTVAAAASQRGHLRLYGLRLNQQLVAMQFGVAMQGQYYAPKVAYDERFARFSPGQLLVRHCLEQLTGEGFTGYDFLGPRATWKTVWTDQVREHHTCYIFRPNLTGRSLHTLTMRAAKAAQRVRHRIWGDPQEIQQ